ncbi:collagen alpha-1(I) chain-like [Lathamus discolor]|uniref:collagen alpha-1(I) chain-like n=1 Tax=Lathamus discolor TaxID=678569 RepID=UPI0032B7D494
METPSNRAGRGWFGPPAPVHPPLTPSAVGAGARGARAEGPGASGAGRRGAGGVSGTHLLPEPGGLRGGGGGPRRAPARRRWVGHWALRAAVRRRRRHWQRQPECEGESELRPRRLPGAVVRWPLPPARPAPRGLRLPACRAPALPARGGCAEPAESGGGTGKGGGGNRPGGAGTTGRHGARPHRERRSLRTGGRRMEKEEAAGRALAPRPSRAGRAAPAESAAPAAPGPRRRVRQRGMSPGAAPPSGAGGAGEEPPARPRWARGRRWRWVFPPPPARCFAGRAALRGRSGPGRGVSRLRLTMRGTGLRCAARWIEVFHRPPPAAPGPAGPATAAHTHTQSPCDARHGSAPAVPGRALACSVPVALPGPPRSDPAADSLVRASGRAAPQRPGAAALCGHRPPRPCHAARPRRRHRPAAPSPAPGRPASPGPASRPCLPPGRPPFRSPPAPSDASGLAAPSPVPAHRLPPPPLAAAHPAEGGGILHFPVSAQNRRAVTQSCPRGSAGDAQETPVPPGNSVQPGASQGSGGDWHRQWARARRLRWGCRMVVDLGWGSPESGGAAGGSVLLLPLAVWCHPKAGTHHLQKTLNVALQRDTLRAGENGAGGCSKHSSLRVGSRCHRGHRTSAGARSRYSISAEISRSAPATPGGGSELPRKRAPALPGGDPARGGAGGTPGAARAGRGRASLPLLRVRPGRD